MKKFLAYCNCFLISFVVFGGATYAIRFALPNNNFILAQSTIHYIAQRQNNSKYTESAVAGVATSAIEVLPTQAPIIVVNNIELPKLCLKSIPDSRSVVDYLYRQNLPYSFTTRQIIAKKVGMDSYDGSSDANLTLLNKLVEYQSKCETI